MDISSPLSVPAGKPYSVYIHIPFCRQRCIYCDFNTVAAVENHLPAYVDALCTEIVTTSQVINQPINIHTVYFGGGTPSLLSSQQVKNILQTIRSAFLLLDENEITLETNPGTLSSTFLKEIKASGVNRLSIGAQSANQAELSFLGRIHDHQQTIEAVSHARLAGFTNISLDLIYGLPRQNLADWQSTLAAILSLQPQHLSLYALKVEPGTPLAQMIEQGVIPEPDDDLAADLLEYAVEILRDNGYAQYEISNWALLDPPHNWQSQHNRQYWKNLPYFGFGAGAHGLFNNVRTENIANFRHYIKAVQNHPIAAFPPGPASMHTSPRSVEEQLEDHLIMGLRLTQEGIDAREIRLLYHIDLAVHYADVINPLIEQGLLEWLLDGEKLRLTPRGRMLGNQVFYRFLAD